MSRITKDSDLPTLWLCHPQQIYMDLVPLTAADGCHATHLQAGLHFPSHTSV